MHPRIRIFIGLLMFTAAVAVIPARANSGSGFSIGARTKISATQGGFGGVLRDNDNLAVAGNIGDLDGDGRVDLLAGALQWPSTDPGRFWVLFLHPDGSVDREVEIGSGAGGFSGQLDPGDGFTGGVVIGDLDGDGLPELAVGVPGDDDGEDDAGAVWILSMNADGTVARETKISKTQGWPGAPIQKWEWFGGAVAPLGDLDGDGVPDLAASAPGDETPDEPTVFLGYGAVYVLFLNPDGSVKAHQKIDEENGGLVGGLPINAYMGGDLEYLGDMDGDGAPELAVTREPGSSGIGFYILSLGADGTVLHQRAVGNGLSGFVGPASHAFGGIVACLGDLDGDGVVDLAVSDTSSGAPVLGSGAVWLLFMNADGTVKGEQRWDGVNGMPCAIEYLDHFGGGLTGLGDLNGDGLLDLAAGVPGDDDGGPQRGGVWVLFPSDTGTSLQAPSIGTRYCSPAVPNSTGLPGVIDVRGREAVDEDCLELWALQLPGAMNIGYFVMGTGANVFTPPGSAGPLCVTPGMVRFLPPVQNTIVGNGGFARVIGTSGPVSGVITPGSTWNFQAWHRDSAAATSNLTDAVSVTFL